MTHKLLRRKEVERICGLSRSSIYAMMKQGTFPMNLKIGLRSVAWLESDIQDFIEKRIRRSK